MIPRVYIAGAYTSRDLIVVNNNVARASAVGDLVCAYGGLPIVPHEIGHRRAQMQTDYKWWVEATLQALRACDAAVVVPLYEDSTGTLGEIAEAERLGIPVFYAIELNDSLEPFYLPSEFTSWMRATCAK